MDELGNCESTEDSHRTQHEQTTKQQPDGEQSQAGVGSSSIYHPVSSSASPAPSATSPPQQVEEDEGAQLLVVESKEFFRLAEIGLKINGRCKIIS